VAWLARADAELERARWAAGDDVPVAGLLPRWREVADLFAQRREPYEHARTLGRLGEVLLAAGDREADDVLAVARATAADLGAEPLAAALEKLVPRHRPAATALTAREAEVLALLADGRSNGEIGRALFISTKTASVHVSNILAKLGAASRGEAVAVARADGLLDD
jgi:DNA-binding CsgD family transcriptional regulator